MKKKASAESTGTELANYDEELAQFAQRQSARVRLSASGRYISTRGKRMKYQDQEIELPFKGVVLDFRYENAYYEGAFDPDSPQPPTCFAVGEEQETLVPDQSSPKMQGGEEQDEPGDNPSCEKCWANQFGTADRGRGKACKNGIRVAVVPEDLEVDEPPLIRVSPTGLRGFMGFMKGVTQRKVPSFAVVTNINLKQDADFPVVTFSKPLSMLPKEQIPKAVEFYNDVQDILMEPYQVSGFETTEKRVRKPGGRRRPVEKAPSAAANRAAAENVAGGGRPKAKPFGKRS